MTEIIFHEETKTFHLYNDKISYLMCVLENGHMGQLYLERRSMTKRIFLILWKSMGVR